MTENIEIPRDTVLDLIHPEEDAPASGFTVAFESEADDDDLCELVIRDDADSLWATTYLSHPEVPAFHGATTVVFKRVVARQKVVTEYVKPDTAPELVAGIDVYACAEAVVDSLAEDIDWMGVAEQHSEEWAHLSEADREAVHNRVHEIATSAIVLIARPDARANAERGQE